MSVIMQRIKLHKINGRSWPNNADDITFIHVKKTLRWKTLTVIKPQRTFLKPCTQVCFDDIHQSDSIQNAKRVASKLSSTAMYQMPGWLLPQSDHHSGRCFQQKYATDEPVVNFDSFHITNHKYSLLGQKWCMQTLCTQLLKSPPAL